MPVPSSHTGKTSLKITRSDKLVKVYVKLDGDWVMFREVTSFGTEEKGKEGVWVGVMGCSPKGQGVKVEFSDFYI